MLKNGSRGIVAGRSKCAIGPLNMIEEVKAKRASGAYVGDRGGTGLRA